MKQLIFSIAILLSTTLGFAHEGHDHDMPTSAKAMKGGVIQSLEKTLIEVVNHKQNLKIYIYNREMKPVTVADYGVQATAELPRSKKQEPISLVDKGQHLEATFDAKGLHRYTLILTLKQPTESHSDTLKFTIEPRKN